MGSSTGNKETTPLRFKVLFWAIALGGAAFDLTNKALVIAWIGEPHTGPPVALIPDLLELRTSYNTGALWGFGRELPYSSLIVVLLSVAAAAAVLYFLFRRGYAVDGHLTAALALMMAGAWGNSYDRLVFGHVRDFLHVHIDAIGLDFAIFNLADVQLVLGAAYLTIETVRFFIAKPTAFRREMMRRAEARSYRPRAADLVEVSYAGRRRTALPLPRSFLAVAVLTMAVGLPLSLTLESRESILARQERLEAISNRWVAPELVDMPELEDRIVRLLQHKEFEIFNMISLKYLFINKCYNYVFILPYFLLPVLALRSHFRPNSKRSLKYEAALTIICCPAAVSVTSIMVFFYDYLAPLGFAVKAVAALVLLPFHPVLVMLAAGWAMSRWAHPRAAKQGPRLRRKLVRGFRLVNALTWPCMGLFLAQSLLAWGETGMGFLIFYLISTSAFIVYLLARYVLKEQLAAMPIVYLRSFGYAEGASAFGRIVARVACRYGAVVALVHEAQKGSDLFSETLISDQAETAVVVDEGWQQRVEDFLQRCSAVVIDCSVITPGVAWEVESARRLVDPSRILIMRSRGVQTRLPEGVESLEYGLDRKSIRAAKHALKDWFRGLHSGV